LIYHISGGSGKTTLARQVFRQLTKEKFGSDSSRAYISLDNYKVDELQELSSRLRNWLSASTSPVLIMLDNVQFYKDLDTLLGSIGLKKGSNVIVTKRNNESYNCNVVMFPYEIPSLTAQDSLKLFRYSSQGNFNASPPSEPEIQVCVLQTI
jgi:AAA domain